MTTATPTTPETILQEDGAQVALAEFAKRVGEAEEAIRRYVAAAEPGAVWTPRELRDATTEGRRSSVMTTAFLNLDKSRELLIDYVASTVVATS